MSEKLTLRFVLDDADFAVHEVSLEYAPCPDHDGEHEVPHLLCTCGDYHIDDGCRHTDVASGDVAPDGTVLLAFADEVMDHEDSPFFADTSETTTTGFRSMVVEWGLIEVV